MTTTVMPPPLAARLMVLVPEGDLPIVELAQRIWALAREAGSAVLLVGLADSPERETERRKALAMLQSHTQYEAVPVSTRIAREPDWVAAVKRLRRPGDQVVVFADQQAPAGVWGLGHQPLAQALAAHLHVQAYVIADVTLPAARRPGPWATLAAWALSLAVVAGFFVLQAWVQAALPGGLGSTLLALSVIVEFGLLGILNQPRL
jgi:hypothetical protein